MCSVDLEAKNIKDIYSFKCSIMWQCSVYYYICAKHSDVSSAMFHLTVSLNM